MALTDTIQKLITTNDFASLEQLSTTMDTEEFEEGLLEATFNNKNLLPYTFICMMLMKKETAELHYLAAEILCLPLCFFEGAYASSLYHARKAIELDPDDISLKEFLLYFYKTPDRLITKEEALRVAKEILQKKPDSSAALGIVERCG